MIRKSVLLFFCLYVVCGAVVAFAETLHVPEDYPTIQAAIDVAQPGDTVRVGPGRYRENLTIGKPLQLVGEERAAVLIHPDDSTLAAVQVVIDEAEVRIEAISVLGGATGIRVHVDNGSRAVIRDVACGYSDVGIYATGDGIVLVQDCVVFETEMICLIAAAREMDIRDNEVFDGETGVLLAGDASCMVENNLIALIDYAVDTYTLSCGWSEGLARFSGDVAGAGNRVHGMVTDLCPPSPTALWPTRFVDDGWASEIDQALRVLVVAADTYEEGGLAQALQGCEEGLALLARADFPAQEAAALGIMGNILGDLGRYEDALEAYARARLVYAVRSAEISVAELDVNEGNASISLGWFDTALAAYQRARGVFSLWGREDDVARTLIGTGVVHSERGDFAVALTAFESAREIYERLADPLDLAGLNNNFGTLYTALERYEEAVEALSAARWVYAARGMELEVAIVDMNLGTAHHELGDYEQALTCYASAREVFETREMDADVAGIENNVGTVYQDLGLYEDALGAYSFARDIYSSLGMAVHVARVNVNVGLLRFDLGRYEKALDAYEQALSVFAAAGMEVDLADVSHNMAIVLSVLDRYEEALDAYELALILYANSDLRISAAQVERNIGALCLGLDFYDEALVSLQSARGVFSESGMALEVARTDGNIGLAYLHQGFVEDARRTFEGALALLDHLQLSAEGTLVNPPFRWQLHYNLGLTLEELTEEEAALIAYEGAIAVIESIRGALTIEELKLAWQEQTKDVYEHLVDLLYRMGEGNSAFSYVERCRARTFLDLLAMGPVETLENVAEEGIRSGAVDASVIESDLEEVVAALPADTVVLEYFVTDEAVYVWTVTAQSAGSPVRIEIDRPTLIDRVVAFRENLEEGPQEGMVAPSPELLSMARDLYDLLIGPVEETIAEFDHLVIVPSGPLYYVPFAALYRCPGAEGRELRGGEYLVERFSVSYTPSLTTLKYAWAIGEQALSEPSLLALADPSHPDASPLPEACEEAQLIGELFPEREIYCGLEATEEMLKTRSQTAQHLLLSTHGKFNAHNPMFSYLALTPTEESDGKLHTYEVFGLPLQADLVVMSACETFLLHFKEMEEQVRAVRGTSEEEPVELSPELLEALTAGDEIVGLTRAFISAGTPSVMSTLWEVVSRPTRDLMVAFYGFLGSGLDLAEALRQAQLVLLKDEGGSYQHPLYWAAFVPYGDWR